jgi:hypothetical protein
LTEGIEDVVPCEANGLPLDDLMVTLELPSNEAVRAVVERGLAATVCSASVAGE